MVRGVFLIAVLSGASVPLAAQSENGILKGVVRDDTGRPLPGVAVTLSGEALSKSLTVTTESDGAYEVTALPAGLLEASFRLPGFAAQRSSIEIGSGEVETLDVTLHLTASSYVVVTGRRSFRNLATVASASELIGVASAASTGVVAASEIEERSLQRAGDVLERVPGLLVSQHSGEGKANQYYVRGFNIDHGTDLAIRVAGIPVNLPTNAHGQGYADVSFLIPELIGAIQYKKGPYHADEGDFSTAGAVNISYLNVLDRPLLKLEAGELGYRRAFAAASPPLFGGHLLAAVEVFGKDGPWVHPDDYRRLNLIARWSRGDSQSGLSVTGMFYDADWSSTDQVPQRALDQGLITRFGAIDPTDGGRSRRFSLSADWQRAGSHGLSRVSAYGVGYELNLWSDFTFLLDDPENGDQFEQEDRRLVGGVDAEHRWLASLGGRDVENRIGAAVRRDSIDPVGLFATRSRERLSTTRQDVVSETSAGFFGESTITWSRAARTTLGLRGDLYDFDVDSSLPVNSGEETEGIVSPKIGVVLGPFRETEIYLNAGGGFHSNDARGTTIHVDPKTGESAEPVDPLVRGWGAEVGVRSLAIDRVHSTAALWWLDLSSELLFVGDAGTTEPSRPSRRWGIEWALDATPRPWLTLDTSVAWSHARFRDDDPAGSFIPGAVQGVATLGAAVHDLNGWLGSVRYRYFGPRPLIEDDSVRSESSHLVTAQLGYTFSDRVTIKLDVFNLFDAEVSDIDYYYASRLSGEPAGGFDDVHTHPVEPRSVRLGVSLRF
jgi:hypothetical protein